MHPHTLINQVLEKRNSVNSIHHHNSFVFLQSISYLYGEWIKKGKIEAQRPLSAQIKAVRMEVKRGVTESLFGRYNQQDHW